MAVDFEAATATLAELEEENSGVDDAFAGFDRINVASVKDRIKEVGNDTDAKDELAVLQSWLKHAVKEATLKKRLKDAEAALDVKVYAQYPKLSVDDIKTLVVDDKWLAVLDAAIHGEMDRVSQALTLRLKELAERYEVPLPLMGQRVTELESKVNGHLEKMGFAWK